MKHQPMLRKTALAAVLAGAGILLGGPFVTAQAADTQAADTQAVEPAEQTATASNAAETTPQGKYIAAQDANQILADDLIGMDVKNAQDRDQDVGKISDVILDLDGKVGGVIVGVGGFLGMGQKDVGMPWDRVQGVNVQDKVVRVNVTKDELKAAPEYKKSADK